MTCKHALPFLCAVLLSACSVFPDGNQGASSSSSSVAGGVSPQHSSSSVAQSGSIVLPAGQDVFMPYFVTTEDRRITELHVIDAHGERIMESFSARGVEALVPGGDLYVRELGPDGFTVLGHDGSDQTDAYLYMKDHRIVGTPDWVYQIDADRVAFGTHDADSDADSPGLFVRRISDGTEQSVLLKDLGMEDRLAGMNPLCLSADGQFIYTELLGWEGFRYNTLWRVRLSDMRAELIYEEDDEIYAQHCHDRSDMILAIRTGMDDRYGMGGAATVPSSLILFDGAAQTSKTLLTTTDTLITRAYITPDGQHIIYTLVTPTVHADEYEDPFWGEGTKSELFSMNIDGTGMKKIGIAHEIHGMSRDGGVIFIGDRSANPQSGDPDYFILNASVGSRTPVTYGDGWMHPVSCGYSRGFDCFYSR